MKKLLLYFLLLLTLSPTVFAQKLNKIEKRIVKIIDENNKEAINFLEQTVNINSGTMNFEGVKKVGLLYKKAFNNLGFKTQWLDGQSFNRAGHLIATFHGAKAKKTVLLIGHLDTVFPKDSEFQKYKKIDNQHVSGPGVADMKGGNTIIIESLKALKATNQLQYLNIKVILTGDEEKSGSPKKLARAKLIEFAIDADIALGFENGDGNPKTANIARRGSIGWTLTTKGNPAHSSQIFTAKVGAGAIFETARILNTWYEALKVYENLTFNPGNIVGGTTNTYDTKTNTGTAFGKTNVVAKETIVNGDLRAMNLQQLKDAKEKMQAIVSKHLLGTNATLFFHEGYPPLAPTDGNKNLLKDFSNISERLGFGKVQAVNPRDAGAADISFCAGHVDQALDGLGMGGYGDHTVNETGLLDTIQMQSKRTAILLYQLTK